MKSFKIKSKLEPALPIHLFILLTGVFLFLPIQAWTQDVSPIQSDFNFYNRPNLEMTSPTEPENYSIFLKSKDGGSDAGGGMGFSKELLDFAEARKGQGKVPFKPSELRLLDAPLEKILKQGLAGSPQFEAFILNLLKNSNRNWFFVKGSLNGYLKTSNIHVLLTNSKKAEVVAVQNSTSVLINIDWLIKSSELDQIGLFVHEALMSIALDFNLPHDNVRELNRIIFAKWLGGGFPNDFELLLSQLGYLEPYRDFLNERGEYSIIESFKSANDLKEKIESEETFGSSKFLRIEQEPRGQIKMIFRVPGPASYKPDLVVYESLNNSEHLELIWFGALNERGSWFASTVQKMIYIYQVKPMIELDRY